MPCLARRPQTSFHPERKELEESVQRDGKNKATQLRAGKQQDR